MLFRSVTITSPSNSAVFPTGSNIIVTATATPSSGTVTKVDLYRGATLFGTSSNAPYSFVVSNAPAGSNSFYAVVTDSTSQVATSAVVNVLVANVGLAITSPVDDAVFASTNPIIVSAFALPTSGTMTNVTFLVDGLPFGQDTAAPFSAVWSTVTSGSHRLTATGRDDSGNAYTSPPVYIAVSQLLVHSNAVWKYLDDGSDQGTAWITTNYNDTAWASGAAELGYGEGDEATVVASSRADTTRIATTYFRRTFVATNVANLTNLMLSLAYDDAGAVYLNGREIYRTANLPAGASATTLATGSGIEETVDTATLSATNLVEGTNVLAVEIHQQSLTSSDISFYSRRPKPWPPRQAPAASADHRTSPV